MSDPGLSPLMEVLGENTERSLPTENERRAGSKAVGEGGGSPWEVRWLVTESWSGPHRRWH